MTTGRHVDSPLPLPNPSHEGPGLTGEGSVGATLVAILPDSGSAGYVVSDPQGERVFGSRVFSTAAEAEAYLLEANRRSAQPRWKVKRLRRRRRDQPPGAQLPLF